MDYKELEYLGLSEKEAKVYLASLQLGSTSAQNIAKKSGINRATTYVQIESLTKKGLMSSFVEGKKQFYQSESPEKLKLLLREQEVEIKKREEYLNKIMPELKSVSVVDKDRPTVRYFEGKNGLKAIASELSENKNEPVMMMYSEDLLKEIFTDEERIQMKEDRIYKNIKTKVLYNYSNGDILSTKDGDRVKIDEKKNPIFCDLTLFGNNKVRITTLKGQIFGLIIENKEIFETLKTIFNLAFERAKKNSRKS